MPRLHADALAFCLAWAALALAGGVLGGMMTGLAVAFGLLVVLMPLSAYALVRKDDERLERELRWAALGAATIALVAWLAL